MLFWEIQEEGGEREACCQSEGEKVVRKGVREVVPPGQGEGS